MVIRIFDISALCHVAINKTDIIDGPVRDIDGRYRQYDLPAGGISYIFNFISRFYQSDVLLFTADRYPEKKVEMLSSYKANRKHDKKIQKMKDVSETILRDCGFPVFATEGYESDDWMYSLCNYLKEREDVAHIFLYTGDSDLYVCIDDNVSVEPISKRDKRITRENFSYSVVKNGNVPWNTLTFEKILKGDVSDNIPPLEKEQQSLMRSKMYYEVTYEYLGDKDFILPMCSNLGDWACNQVNLVFPLDLEVNQDCFVQPDKGRIKMWADAMSHRMFPTYGVRDTEIDYIINNMVDRGLYADD